jgi:hypothetical protein
MKTKIRDDSFLFEIFSWGFFRPYSNPDFVPLEAVESPPEMAAKSLDLNTALIFFGNFFASRQKSNDAKINFK